MMQARRLHTVFFCTQLALTMAPTLASATEVSDNSYTLGLVPADVDDSEQANSLGEATLGFLRWDMAGGSCLRNCIVN